MPRTPDEHALLLEEFRQAWEHYRHLENGRDTAFAFFFTAFFGAVGLIAHLLKGAATPSEVYFWTAPIALCLGSLSVAVRLQLSKTSVVNGHYIDVIRLVRAEVLQDRALALNLDVYQNQRVTTTKASVTRIAAWLLNAASVLSLLYTLFAMFHTWPDVPRTGILGFYLLALLALLRYSLRVTKSAA